jgi:hypothetical protein
MRIKVWGLGFRHEEDYEGRSVGERGGQVERPRKRGCEQWACLKSAGFMFEPVKSSRGLNPKHPHEAQE